MMNITNSTYFKCSQIILGFIFTFLVMFPNQIPIHVPYSILRFIDSSLGIVTIFAISVLLFCYANPILALLFVFVAYLTIRHSSMTTPNEHNIQYTPKHHIDDSHMFPSKSITLEEQVVNRMAPLGNKEPTGFIDSTFKPMYNNLNSASLF